MGIRSYWWSWVGDSDRDHPAGVRQDIAGCPDGTTQPCFSPAGACYHSGISRQSRIVIHLETLAMTQPKRFTAFLLTFVLAFLVGCASTPKQEGTGEYVDDTVITTKVKAAVLNEPSLKSAEINVETFKGVVQLSGFVRSQADISKAVDVARSVGGVKSVKNDMRLK